MSINSQSLSIIYEPVFIKITQDTILHDKTVFQWLREIFIECIFFKLHKNNKKRKNYEAMKKAFKTIVKNSSLDFYFFDNSIDEIEKCLEPHLDKFIETCNENCILSINNPITFETICNRICENENTNLNDFCSFYSMISCDDRIKFQFFPDELVKIIQKKIVELNAFQQEIQKKIVQMNAIKWDISQLDAIHQEIIKQKIIEFNVIEQEIIQLNKKKI